MKPSDLEETIERYRNRWKEFGYDPRTLGWNKGQQGVRFAAALEGLRSEDFSSVFDVGCGFGDFLGHLRTNAWNGRYTGVDVVPELISEAKRRYRGEKVVFCCTDIQKAPLNVKASMGLALGLFNHRLHENNMTFISSMLERMWEATTAVVVLDFLSTSADSPRDDLFYADPSAIYQLAARFSRRIMIHHAYMPFEFQVKIWHDDAFSKDAPVFAPYAAQVNRGHLNSSQ